MTEPSQKDSSAALNILDWERWLPLFVGLLAMIPFLPALWGGFVMLDDDFNFVNNPHYRGLGVEQLHWMFSFSMARSSASSRSSLCASAALSATAIFIGRFSTVAASRSPCGALPAT